MHSQTREYFIHNSKREDVATPLDNFTLCYTCVPKYDFSFVLLYALYAHLNTAAMKIIPFMSMYQ